MYIVSSFVCIVWCLLLCAVCWLLFIFHYFLPVQLRLLYNSSACSVRFVVCSLLFYSCCLLIHTVYDFRFAVCCLLFIVYQLLLFVVYYMLLCVGCSFLFTILGCCLLCSVYYFFVVCRLRVVVCELLLSCVCG